ncbi:MAG: tlde1 domain-containing protein [Tardiphaga sp.]
MFVVGAALAGVAVTGGWLTAGGLFHNGVTPGMVSANLGPDPVMGSSSFAERFSPRADMSFASRFEPAVKAPLASEAPAEPEKQVAWFDPTYSMGAPPARFARRAPADEATVPAPAAKPQEVALMQPAPTVKQLVASIPTPAARPADARMPQAPEPQQHLAQASAAKGGAFGHDALVQKARMALMSQPKSNNFSLFDKLFGDSQKAAPGPVLAYAGSDGGVLTNGTDAAAASEPSLTDRTTAVYDISARKVYMPDGTKLEAHSGLGARLDNPSSANEKMRGVTPPHVYDLKLREALFHGVAAIRLTPVGGDGAIYGRNGLLAHTYMLGPNGDSNGCVSFRDYNKFLQAYRNGEVKRLVVVAKLD